MQSQRGLDVSDRRSPPLQSASCLQSRPWPQRHRMHSRVPLPTVLSVILQARGREGREYAATSRVRVLGRSPRVETSSLTKFLTDAGTPFHFCRPDMSGLTGAISSPSILVTLVGDSGLPFHSSGLHWLPTQRPRDRSTHFGITRGWSRTHDLRPSGLQGGDATNCAILYLCLW